MMTDDWLDFYLDNILKASGSALKHYSMQKTKDDMRQALRQAIAGLESQEPVEWGVDWGKDGNSVSIIKRLANGNIEVLAWEYAPHPPQRTWVGLMDEEITSVANNSHPLNGVRSFARAIEAKLKEKNT
jgi:hypothetical protein